MRILLVEDDENTAVALCKLLEMKRHEVILCGSLQQTQDTLRRDQAFDLMLCDIGLPDGDGWKLGPLAQSLHIPALATSAYVMPQDHERSTSSGFLEHIDKPFSAEMIDRIISRYDPSAGITRRSFSAADAPSPRRASA